MKPACAWAADMRPASECSPSSLQPQDVCLIYIYFEGSVTADRAIHPPRSNLESVVSTSSSSTLPSHCRWRKSRHVQVWQWWIWLQNNGTPYLIQLFTCILLAPDFHKRKKKNKLQNLFQLGKKYFLQQIWHVFAPSEHYLLLTAWNPFM